MVILYYPGKIVGLLCGFCLVRSLLIGLSLAIAVGIVSGNENVCQAQDSSAPDKPKSSPTSSEAPDGPSQRDDSDTNRQEKASSTNSEADSKLGDTSATSPQSDDSSRMLNTAQSNEKTLKKPVSQLRRPTTPTDAQRLADRPPKPKFVRPAGQPKPSKYDLTFDDLAFEIGDGEEFRWSMITPQIHEYDGATISLRGYIRPSFSQKGLKQFVFVRDNQECCFGPGAALFDCVLVKMAEGEETSYTVRPITLEGEFYLRKYAGPDGNVWAIYRLKDARVK